MLENLNTFGIFLYIYYIERFQIIFICNDYSIFFKIAHIIDQCKLSIYLILFGGFFVRKTGKAVINIYDISVKVKAYVWHTISLILFGIFLLMHMVIVLLFVKVNLFLKKTLLKTNISFTKGKMNKSTAYINHFIVYNLMAFLLIFSSFLVIYQQKCTIVVFFKFRVKMQRFDKINLYF